MNISRITILACLLTGAVALSANAYAQGKQKPKDCWQTAMTQSDLDQCAGKQAKNADEKLQNVYSEILKEYADDSVFTKAFKASQKAWLAYRDAQMKMMFPHTDEPAYYGTALPMCEAQYRKELTDARTAQLMQWIKGTPEGDVCSGSLKTSSSDKNMTTPLETHSPSATTGCRASKTH